jgi:hypothetical protein
VLLSAKTDPAEERRLSVGYHVINFQIDLLRKVKQEQYKILARERWPSLVSEAAHHWVSQ